MSFTTTKEELTQVWKAWTFQSQLPLISADELLVEEGLTQDQKGFIREFIELWEQTEGEK